MNETSRRHSSATGQRPSIGATAAPPAGGGRELASGEWRRFVWVVFTTLGSITLVVVLALLEGCPADFWRIEDPATAKQIVNILARASVTLISSVLASLFLAIPLTANNYTPQLIDVFMRSRANRAVLAVYVFSAAFSIWLALVTGDRFVPTIQILVSLAIVTLSLFMLLPYMFAILRLIDPNVIIAEVAKGIHEALNPASRRPIEARRRRFFERVDQLGNIALRSIDRADRDTALDAITALERSADRALEVKRHCGADWFEVTSEQFPGFSPEAIGFLNRDKTWMETDILRQMSRAFVAALTKGPDVLSAISRSVRHFGIYAAILGDHRALETAIRFFNNFLREALKKRDQHAIYDVLFQYRQLAERLVETDTAHAVAVVDHLEYYSRMAAAIGVSSALDIIGYDAGAVVVEATRLGPEGVMPFVESFLRIRRSASEDVSGLSGGLLKARVIVAAELEAAGLTAAAGRVEATLATVDRKNLEVARRELLDHDVESFWEVTDRQINLDYVRPALRPFATAVIEKSGK